MKAMKKSTRNKGKRFKSRKRTKGNRKSSRDVSANKAASLEKFKRKTAPSEDVQSEESEEENQEEIHFKPGRLGLSLKGASITAVDPSGSAAKAGVKAGWRILEVNGSPASDDIDLRIALKKAIKKEFSVKFAQVSQVQAVEEDLSFQSRFERDVAVARGARSPAWVKGPRPSNECIVMHDAASDPRGIDVTALDVAKMRLEHQDSLDLDWPVSGFFKAEEIDARGVPCRWANWPYLHGHAIVDIKLGVILYLHRGNLIAGAPDVYKCAHLSRATQKAVLTVDYRMAPEHPLPAATVDVVSAYRWLVEDQKVPPGKITIYGRSAGATLVVLSLQEIVKQALPLPACGVASSAWAPHPTQSKLWDIVVGNTNAKGLGTGQKNDVHDAKYNIWAANFCGFPPLYVMAGDAEQGVHDLDASKRLEKLAREAGVQTSLDIVANMQQCPDCFVGFVPEATQAVARANSFVNDASFARSGG